jgi:putative DNA primase/helicase
MTDFDKIRAALSFVCPDDRDTWVRMGMAVKDELGSAGFDIWDDWSQQSDTYQPAAARSVWKSFKAGGKISIGSLLHEAKACGWQDDATHAKPDPAEIERRRAERAKREADEQQERQRRARIAALKAAGLWASASQVGQSRYLDRKQVVAESVRYLPDGSIIVPMMRYDMPREKALVGAQVIKGDGEKRFTPGTAKQGSACRLGLVEVGKPILVSEGYATGLSIRAGTEKRHPVFVAFDAGNLGSVVELLRSAFPTCPILICADDDWQTTGNPGVSKAKKIVKLIPYVHFIYPIFPMSRGDKDTDFNDLHLRAGIDEVKRQFAAPLAHLSKIVVRRSEGLKRVA